MKDIYFISGLGADERLLQYLDLKQSRIHHIRWISPERKESWENYAKRLLPQIKTEKPVLIGVSLGGMMAIELNKLITVEKTILISSSKTKDEIPPYFKILKHLKFHRWLPYSWITKTGLALGKWIFGPKNEGESKLLREIILHTDETFFKWAWDRVADWDNTFIPKHLTHIHGNRDHMLPIQFVKPNITLKKGTHLMVFHHAEEISDIINYMLSKEN